MNSGENFSMEVLCKPFICLPITNQPVKYAKNNFEFLKDLNLADPGTKEEINMLTGFDFYWSLVTGKVKMGKTGEPIAIETKFGRVLNGPLNEKASQGHATVINETKSHVLNLCFEPTKIVSLESDLKRSWDLETLGIIQKEESIHEHFIKSIHLNKERRYENKLPFKENHPILYDNFDLCAKQNKYSRN